MNIITRLLLTVTNIAWNQQDQKKIAISLIILILALGLEAYKQPYQNVRLRNLSFLVQGVLIVSVVMSSFLVDSSTTGPEYMAVAVIVLLSNVSVILMLVVNIARQNFDMVFGNLKVRRVLDYLGQKFEIFIVIRRRVRTFRQVFRVSLRLQLLRLVVRNVRRPAQNVSFEDEDEGRNLMNTTTVVNLRE